MSKQQLYINGVAVDMPNEEIKIKAESNIFNDIGKIMTAHSYSISLPRTMTNDAVLGNAFVPAADTGGKTTHTYLSAALHVDGLPLFDGGQAVLNKVDDKGYNINLYWGLLSVFEEIKNEDLNLNELPLSLHWQESYATWTKLIKYMGGPNPVTGMNDAIYATLDSESKELADSLPWTMPFIRASDILDKVATVYGLPISWSALARYRAEELYHPLLTRIGKLEDETAHIMLGAVVARISSEYFPTWYEPATDSNGLHQYASYGIGSGLARATSRYIADNVVAFEDDSQFKIIKAASKFSAKSVRIYGECDKAFSAVCFFSDETGDWQADATYNSATGLYELDRTWKDGAWDKGDRIADIGVQGGNYWNAMPSTLDVHIDIEVDEVDDIGLGLWWCWERNYPEMGIIDYMGEILAHIGACVVGSITKAESLQIKTFDEILQASPTGYDSYGVESIEMAFGKLAQKNIYTHKENDDTDVTYTADGVTYTADSTLKLEETAFSSKFKVPRLALMRLWKVEKNKNANDYNAEWDAAGEYICGFDWTMMVNMNTGQDFASILANCYVGYEAMMSRPKVVEVAVRLSVLDLLAFDMSRPVYINQLGRAYLIESIESDSGEQFKLKLIQI